MLEKAAVAWVGHLTEAPRGSQLAGLAGRTAARAWTAVAGVALLLATAFALAVVALRWPGVNWGSPTAFRVALLLHVNLAIVVWLWATAAAQWSAASALPRWPAAAGLLATGLVGASFLAGGEPVMADYFPWLSGNALFALGMGLFAGAIGAVAGLAVFAARARRERPEWRGVGLTALPFLLAALAGVGEIFRGVREGEALAWVIGHVLLFGHVALMCWEWPRLAGRPVGNGPLVACALAAAALVALPWLGVLSPGALKVAYTASMQLGLWLPPLWVAVAIVRAGGTSANGSRAWLLSAGLLVAGGMLGALIDGATTLVTAHYHAAMGAVVVSRMAMSYRAARTLAAGPVPVHSARRQLVTYALGLVLLSGGLAVASLDGAPRKTSAAATVHKGPAYRTGMAISGSGGGVALVGTVWLVLNLARTRRREKYIDDGRNA